MFIELQLTIIFISSTPWPTPQREELLLCSKICFLCWRGSKSQRQIYYCSIQYSVVAVTVYHIVHWWLGAKQLKLFHLSMMWAPVQQRDAVTNYTGIAIHTQPWLKGQNPKTIWLNIHFLHLHSMTRKRRKLVQRPTRTFSCAQWSLSWVRDESQWVSYPCGDGWRKGQTVLCVPLNPQGFEGQSAFLQSVDKNYESLQRKKRKTKKKILCLSFSCLQSNRNWQICLSACHH